MSKVVIQVMSDWNDCEQCGGGSEDGGVVMIDNEVVFSIFLVFNSNHSHYSCQF